MRFITEFECDGTAWDMTPAIVSHRKANGQMSMGNKIAELFGWQKNAIMSAMGPHTINWSLEIEAFPMDKWVEFRKKLISELPEYDAAAKIRIMNALSDLEKPVKPEHEQSKTTK